MNNQTQPYPQPQLQLQLEEKDQKILSQNLTEQQQQTLNEQILNVRQFINQHSKNNSKNIVLLTSGGTSVPLEKKTVRMVENFSTGTRGSLLAQQVLQEGFPLIYFYRDNSFIPYTSGISINQLVINHKQQQLQKLIKAQQQIQKHSPNLLLLPFKTIYYYLSMLIQLKKILPYKSIIILCAAVSDFIPEETSQHKIHTQDSLEIRFRNSPKILGKLVDGRHLTVSFKLETDKSKIDERVCFAIEKFKVDMVVGNLLNNKNWVKIVYNSKLYAEHQKQKQFNTNANTNENENVNVNRQFEFTSQIQKNIIKAVCECNILKFKK